MNRGIKKYNAMFLAMCMVVTAFVAMSLSVSAQIDFNTELQLQGNGRYTGYYVGGTGNNLIVTIIDIDTVETMSEAYVNITTTDADIDFTQPNGNNNGNEYTTGAGEFLRESGVGTNQFIFVFDIEDSCPIGDHTATLTVDYDTTAPSARRMGVTLDITIEIGSRATTSTSTSLYAGDDFKELVINVDPSVPNSAWDETYLNITRPDSDFTWQSSTVNADTATAWIPGSGSLPSTGADFKFRIGVEDDKAPDIYTFTYTLEFTAGGTRYFESANEIDIVVDFTPIVEASGTTIIQQGNTTVQFPVTFTNNGNVDLINVEVKVDPITMGNLKFFEEIFDHYEGTLPALYYDWSPIGDLAMGASADAMLTAALDLFIPAGEHKILLDWRGYYNNDGQIETSSGVVEADGDWTGGAPVYDERTSEMSTTDFETNTHTGAFIIIDVTDDELSFSAALVSGGGTIDASGDVTNRVITIRLTNKEQIRYKDLFVELEAGPGTPFLNPIDHSATTVEMDTLLSDFITPSGTRDINFHVDVNVAWWQDNSEAPGMFVVDIIVDGTNDDTEDRIEDTEVPVAMEIIGFGPELFATAVTYESIKPGDEFTLTITIENFGDDTAREVDAYLRADFISGWTIVDQFTTSVGSYGGFGDNPPVGDASWGWVTDFSQYTQFNRSHDIRPGEIGIDSVVDIVELHDWMQRRETPPQGKILWIHLDRLAAGDTHSFVFEMISDVNMVEGMVYIETLDLYYVDSNGETYGPPGSMTTNWIEGQQVLIRTGKGDKYTGTDDMDWSVVLYAIIFLIIAFIVFIIGYALGGKGGGGGTKMEEPSYQSYEDEYTPPEPSPPMEEEIGPPLPEDKPPE